MPLILALNGDEIVGLVLTGVIMVWLAASGRGSSGGGGGMGGGGGGCGGGD
jgi:hypothetical protein